MSAVAEMVPPFDLPEGVFYDGQQEFLGRVLLVFTDRAVTGSTVTLKPALASAEALAARIAELRASFGVEVAA